MIESHLRLWQMGGEEGIPTRRAIYRFFRDTDEVSLDIIFLTLADYLATYGPNLNLVEWKQHCQLMEYILSEREKEGGITRPPKLIDGHDIMDVLGVSPGPLVGELLTEVREAQASGELNTKEEAIALVRQSMEQRHCGAAC